MYVCAYSILCNCLIGCMYEDYEARIVWACESETIVGIFGASN